MIEIYLKYDNMHVFGMINALNCINNHVNSCKNSMLSECTVETRKFRERVMGTKKKIERVRSIKSEKEGERDRNEEC